MDGGRALAIAEALLALPTVPFREELPAAAARAFAEARQGLHSARDAAGNVVVRYEGESADVSRPLVLVAHLDHPGFVVDEVDGALLSLSFLGGLSATAAVPGSPLDLFAPGVPDAVGRAVVNSTAAGERGFLTSAAAELVEGEAPVDGFAMWGFPGWSVVDGLITARVCDDLLGAAAVLATLDALATDAPPGVAVWGLLTRAEEVGFLGALEAIRLGTVPTGASVLSLETSKARPDAPQGGGVVVRVGDRMSVFDPRLTAALWSAAQASGIPAQRKLMDGGACEATAFCAAGYRASGLCVPLGGYHNAADDGQGVVPETVAVDDFLAEVELLDTLARTPSLLDPTDGPPAWLAPRMAEAQERLQAERRVSGRPSAV